MNANTALELCQRHVRHEEVDFVPFYGEPGYSDPQAGVLFADWNDCPKWLTEGLERRGFALEWSDEWLLSHETGKAYRSSPDSYAWKPFYVMTDDGDVIGGDEIESGNQLDWYINEYLLNDSDHCNLFDIDLKALGFTQYNGQFESGFHPGQTDDPRAVARKIERDMPDHDFVLSLDSKGQFDARWSAWVRQRDAD